MKSLLLSAVALLAVAAAPAATPSAAKITGDYVEVRTASVFAGACHYNGELVTTGKDAVLAFNFTSGAFRGVDLGHVRAVASVSSEANLIDQKAPRKLELVVDSSATDAQTAAVAALIKSRELGEVVSIRRAPVTFSHTADRYTVKAEGFAAMNVQPMPNAECCKQPNLIWYSPLVPLTDRKVGYTQSASATPKAAGTQWQHEGENSAFYGSFSF